MTEFPERWARASIGEVATLINGRAFKPTDWGSSGLPIIRIQNLNRPDATYNYFDGSLDPRHEVQPSELLFAWSGTPGTSFGAHIWSGPRAALNQHIFRVLHSEDLLDRKFFREAINNQLDELIRRAHGGAGLAHVTKDKFESIEIPVPSLAEQHRIVAKLEELFSELDAGVAALRRAQRRLARYRQSLLQAAVTGELTREWREQTGEGTDHSESLKRTLLRDRKTRWGHRNPWKTIDRYKPACEPREEAGGGLPPSWAWISFAQATDDITVGHVGPMSTRYRESGIPFLRSQNIRPLHFSRDGLVFIDRTFQEELSKSCLSGGELLVVRTGVNVGDACALPPLNAEANCADLVIARPMPQLDPGYGAVFINSPAGKTALRLVQTGNAQPHFNIGAMERLGFPLPPLKEQHAILSELDRRLSAADALDATFQTSLRRAERLRQSILERAFRGELVPQDPNDEPAEALLARLKAAAPDTPIPRRRGRPPKTEPAEPQAPRRRGRPRKQVSA